jgi:uncharacterized protein with NAD-binding domain and iron-sulfur cluster
VVILGGGVAGMTAAHELAEQGLDVTLLERRAWGGKARSIGVSGTASGGRSVLPGEHGFRFFQGMYANLPDVMSRIPFATQKRGVRDNLVDTKALLLARTDREDVRIPLGALTSNISPQSLLGALTGFYSAFANIPPDEAAFLAQKLVVFLTSGDLRRRHQWEYRGWWDFVGAESRSADYRATAIKMLTTTLVAAKAEVANARTIGEVAELFVWSELGRGNDLASDSVLNGPTNEVFIKPWVSYLRSLGVDLRLGYDARGLVYVNGRVTGVRVVDQAGQRRIIEADHVIVALPAEKAAPMFTRAMVAADPQLGRVRRLESNWMNGLQFFLTASPDINRGHTAYMDSPWAVTSLTQRQFWRGDFASKYGDGTVMDVLSTDISDWNTPGILFGKTAKECTPKQIAREVWAQVRTSLDSGTTRLPDKILHSWYLDEGITGAGTPSVHNEDPLLINTIGSWDNRPEATTRVQGLSLAGDWVRTSRVNLASMEAACESGRKAANAALKAVGSTGRVDVRTRYKEPALALSYAEDDLRFRAGLPNLWDLREPDWPDR